VLSVNKEGLVQKLIRAVLLKGWFSERQHQHHLRVCEYADYPNPFQTTESGSWRTSVLTRYSSDI